MSEFTITDGNETNSYSRRAATGIRITQENPIALKAGEHLATYLERSADFSRRKALPHQEVILQDILDGLYEGEPRGFVESPTATGKTYLMCRMAEAFYDAGARVLLLCDRRQQADQILGKVGDTGLLQVTDSMDFRDIGVHYEHTRASRQDKVVISTYASMNHFAETGELGNFDVILADEAHKTLGPVTSRNLTGFSPDAVKVGFTATPAYSVEKKVTEIFDYPYHSTSLKEAIENDLVAPLTCLIYATDAEIPYLDIHEEFTQEELNKLINMKPRNEKAVEFAKDFIADGRQGIIACVPGSNMAHARLLAQELDGDFVKLPDGLLKFIRARAVGGFQSHAENRRILQEFELGQVDIITFVDLISEGWNSQGASFLIDLLPTTSIVKKTQKIGRIIRKKPDNLQSIVVDFMDISSKGQVTALDALKERRFVLGRSYGSRDDEETARGGGGGGGNWNNKRYIEKLLNSDLWYELQHIDMRKVADLRLRASSSEPSVRDPIFAKYEQMMGKGYERETVNSMNLPASVINGVSAYIRRHTREQRLVPEAADIAEHIKRQMPANKDRAELIAQLALQGFDAESDGLLQDDPETPDELTTEDVFDEAHRHDGIRKAMAALPEREQLILELRYGFNGEPWTYEAISHEIDLTRERVRQLEGQALGRLAMLREIAYLAGEETIYAPHEYRKLFAADKKMTTEERVAMIDKNIHANNLEAVKLVYGTYGFEGRLADGLKAIDEPASWAIQTKDKLYKWLDEIYQAVPEKAFAIEVRPIGTIAGVPLDDRVMDRLPGPADSATRLKRDIVAQMLDSVRLQIKTGKINEAFNDSLSFNSWISDEILKAHRNSAEDPFNNPLTGV